jgi:hypothetical protein
MALEPVILMLAAFAVLTVLTVIDHIAVLRASATAHVRSVKLIEDLKKELSQRRLLIESDDAWFVTLPWFGVSLEIPIREITERFHNNFHSGGRGTIPPFTFRRLCTAGFNRTSGSCTCVQSAHTNGETSLDSVAGVIRALTSVSSTEWYIELLSELSKGIHFSNSLRYAIIAELGLALSPISRILAESVTSFGGEYEPVGGTITVTGSPKSTSWRISVQPDTGLYQIEVRLPGRKGWAIVSEEGGIDCDPIELSEKLSFAPRSMADLESYHTLDGTYGVNDYDWSLVKTVAKRHAPLRRVLISEGILEDDEGE